MLNPKEKYYFSTKSELLSNTGICAENKNLYRKFLELQEYKLKRINNLKQLDEGCYKTLTNYVYTLRNVNTWFKNKSLNKITKEDIKQVYDDLEDGKLIGSSGKIITSTRDYCGKLFKSKLFEIAGKKELAQEVMQFYSPSEKREVRFFDEQTFKKIANFTQNIEQRLLCWLAWDFGENIFTLLQLQKKDFVRRIDEETKEPEYLLIFPQHKIKRSRTARSEPTLYKETTDLLDAVLPTLKDEDRIFNFEYRNAVRFLKQVKEAISAKTLQGHFVTWKDFRSSMACNLLDIGWTTDEIKSRLGHKPSSDVLDMYVSYKALNKRVSKKKVEEGKMRQLVDELEEFKRREKLSQRKFEDMNDKMERMEQRIARAESVQHTIQFEGKEYTKEGFSHKFGKRFLAKPQVIPK